MFNIGEMMKIDAIVDVTTPTIKKCDQELSFVHLVLGLVWNLSKYKKRHFEINKSYHSCLEYLHMLGSSKCINTRGGNNNTTKCSYLFSLCIQGPKVNEVT